MTEHLHARIFSGALARTQRLRRPTIRLVAVVSLALGLLGGSLLAGIPLGSPSADQAQVLPEVPVTAMDIATSRANNSPALVADPTDPEVVALANRVDAPDFGCALQMSGDGGRSWTTAGAPPSLPPGAEKCYAPEVAFDQAGRLYYLFVGLAGGGNRPMGVFLSTSSDKARAFSPPQQVLGPLNFSVRMAIDRTMGARGRMHLTWLHAESDPATGGFGPPPNPILAAYSDDGGQTFSEPVQVSDPSRPRVVAPALSLGPDHTVAVAYYDLEDDARDYQGLEGPTWDKTWSLVVAQSSDGGGSFGQGQIVDDAVVPSERVMLIYTMAPPALVSYGEGDACVAWTDARFGDPDVLLRCSTGGGHAWTDLRRLNDDPVGNGKRQYLPRLSVSSQGRLDAIFYDRRADPQNSHNDVSYTYARDGTLEFVPNIRLTASASDAHIGPQYANVAADGQFEIGSRLGLLSLPGGVVGAWGDARNSRFSGLEQDIFATAVHVPASGRNGWLALVGGALLLVSATGILLLAFSRRTQSSPEPSECQGR